MRHCTLATNVAVAGILLLVVPFLQAQTQPATAVSISGSGGSVQLPSGWYENRYANAQELWNVKPERLASLSEDERDALARITFNITPCANHAEAVQRLRQIEAEWGMTSTYDVVGGWPALHRRLLVPKPEEGDDFSGTPEWLVMVTTAVAVDATVVRIDGFGPEAAAAQVVAQLDSIGRSFLPAVAGDPQQAADQAQQLRNSPSLRTPVAAAAQASALEEAVTGNSAPSAAARPAANPGKAVNLGTSNLQIGSESEIAVSPTGTNIVVAQQCHFDASNDGGATFPYGGGAPGDCTGGDSSVAYGKSGNFYWETIGSNPATCPSATPNCNNTQQIAVSTNNGQSFAFSARVVDCLVTSGCGFGNVPDQEHIAADRVNASGSNQDQVYAVFREGFGYGISCSTDSAATWKAVTFYNNGSTDFPRITVAPSGTVFVVTINGNNIELDSFSQCQNGLTQGLKHVSIATGINQVTCPVSGLDRCNNGNILSSQTVAVDDTNSNHLYASYAVNTVAPAANASFPGNENVLVRESTDGGAHWSSAVQVNQGTSGTGGRRFQPWICVTEGTAFVSWFDRRASTSTANDLTDYYSSSAFDSGGTLTAGTDFKISGASDPECASGWPCLSRSQYDSESCSTQPQFGGSCRHTPNNSMDSKTACNFASPVCPATETCQGGSGCPKYADYTGNACVLGRLYNVWPSATNQPGALSTSGNINSFFVESVVAPTATTTTYTGPVTQAYLGSVTLSATLVLQGTAVPVVGQTITFVLGTQSCMGVTGATGSASCGLALTQPAGQYTVSATFVATGNYLGSTNSKPFTIVAPPVIGKSFAATKIVPGSTTTLSFKISNPNNFVALTGIGFTDVLPVGLLVASPTGLTSTCVGTVTALAGSGTISLAGGVIAASGSCTIQVVIKASNTDGIYHNITSAVTSNEGGLGNMGSASITVAYPPGIKKAFSVLAIPSFGSATLTFTVNNPNTTVAFTGVAFSDTLPTGLKISTPAGLTGTCGGGVITAVAGTSIISLSGAALAPGASCTFSVNVTAGATGALVNTTGPITSDQTVPGTTASATITVGGVFEVNYSANLSAGDGFINITNTGENGASLDGPGFGPPAGNLCVNVYAFAADEQLISCCSCLVTPGGLASLSIRKDILFNPAQTGTINEVVVKLVSTLAGSGGTGTTCASSAATPGTLASGLEAWGTTLHLLPTNAYGLTENAFVESTLSVGEMNSITNRCTAIIGNDSGAGICNSCRDTGL